MMVFSCLFHVSLAVIKSFSSHLSTTGVNISPTQTMHCCKYKVNPSKLPFVFFDFPLQMGNLAPFPPSQPHLFLGLPPSNLDRCKVGGIDVASRASSNKNNVYVHKKGISKCLKVLDLFVCLFVCLFVFFFQVHEF